MTKLVPSTLIFKDTIYAVGDRVRYHYGAYGKVWGTIVAVGDAHTGMLIIKGDILDGHDPGQFPLAAKDVIGHDISPQIED